ncbi:MAG: preprotein translocase subunit SecA [Myxococcota bacterium]|nr:preprotein translocase subunit SecA [Myxococcota bacterium]
MNPIRKIFGTANERRLKKLRPVVDAVNGIESRMEALSDDDLRAFTPEFKQRLENGASLDDLMVEAFAVVRETSKRVLGMRPFDCQLIGGKVLHDGCVAEMKTGEGKTLVATMPTYLNALTGKGVHVVTVNDYLAGRDADWMGQIYRFLGMDVGKILSNERNDQIKRASYAADITYGTNNEFGFDYLRDNMKFRIEDYTQRPHNFCIIDEVDSILIDEARTPLIISGPTNDSVDLYFTIDAVIPLLLEEIDYVSDAKSKGVDLTEEGISKVEDRLGIDNLYDPNNMVVLHHVNQALKAHHIFKRDKDYVVQGGKVVIVDEHTGRLMAGRRWSDGLHQAVEAKEKLTIENESQTYATITFQNYFRMYNKLAGMTGTAETEAAEFANIYDLDTFVIPTNVPIARDDQDDIVYLREDDKFRAVLEDIVESNKRGQPVLVGTTSVEKSEIVSRMLKRAGIAHETLNAKNHSREGHIVTQAGRLGAVTISTNMAGRGTDIKLGGNAEEMAKDLVSPEEDPEGFEAKFSELKEQCSAEREKVLAAGGLRIVGTERHESRRIDNQLRGRAGRQGDLGSSKFYLSLEDDLLKIFGSDKILAFVERWGNPDDEEPIEHRFINRALENAQKKVEGHNFNIRKNLLEYDDVLNAQRQAVYELRRRALMGENIREMMLEAIEGVSDDIMDDTCPPGIHPEEWDIEQMRKRMLELINVSWDETDDELRDFSQNELKGRLMGQILERYEEKEGELGEDNSRQIERMLLLQFTDQLWKDHLLAMDRLRDGIGLRGYGQRNPLLEYKKEGFNMFMMMNALRDEAVVNRILRTQMNPEVEGAAEAPTKKAARGLASGALNAPRPAAPAPGPGAGILPPRPQAPARPAKGMAAKNFAVAHGIKRNEPCPCGSGLKFKKCCYNATEDQASV